MGFLSYLPKDEPQASVDRWADLEVWFLVINPLTQRFIMVLGATGPINEELGVSHF